jgi:hypothetical protein
MSMTVQQLCLRSALAATLLLAGCKQPGHPPPAFTKAQLATVERNVTYCTAATGKLTPLIARADHKALADAAIDARNRCSTARAEIAVVIGSNAALDVCRRDVDAQERVSIAELSNLDATSMDRRAAVVHALDEAIGLQSQCAKAMDALR